MTKSILVALLALTPLVVADAAAQVPGINLNIFPRVGVYKPSSQLGNFEAHTRELAGGIAIGLSAELALPVLPDIRANLEYVPGVAMKSDDLETEDKENTLLALTGDLVINLAPPLSPVKPYGLLGGGVKRYELDPAEVGVSKHSDLTLHVGAGVGIKLGPLSLVGEASDYISWFKYQDGAEGKMQNDIFIMVGFKIGMF